MTCSGDPVKRFYWELEDLTITSEEGVKVDDPWNYVIYDRAVSNQDPFACVEGVCRAEMIVDALNAKFPASVPIPKLPKPRATFEDLLG